MDMAKRKAIRMKRDKRLVSLSAEAFGAYAPPRPMDIVAWCERYRRLSPEASAEPGPYRVSRAPFFAEVMRACVDPEVREVVVMGASQIAKTESCILNVLAYKIANDPAPSLLVTSTLPACHSLSHDRFEPMVRDSEPLRGLVAESGAPSSESTIYRKTFPDGHLTLVGSNSASGLARMPIRDLYLTEVDRFALEAGRGEGEGDPVSLARIRTSTFHDSKVIMESSPTIAGRSRIEAAYLNSTQEHWYNACPNCGFFQILAFGRVDFATLFHRCEHCGEKFNQSAWQSSPGEWRTYADHPTIRGFQISALASPLISWSTIVEEFKVANRLAGEGDPSQLKVFVNTRLAEPYVEAEARMSEDELLVRSEEYQAEIPDGVLILLAALDTQDNRLQYLMTGIGKGREMWLIETGAIWGALATDAVSMYMEVDERILNRIWHFSNGKGIKVRRCVQDALGHHSSTVYAAVKQRPRVMIAFRGRAPGSVKTLYTISHSAQERAPVLSGTVELAKDLLSNLLKVQTPGRGYIHVPADPARGFDEHWSAEMTAEKKVVKYRAGQRIATWEKRPGARNEAWDLMVMTLILAESMQLNMENREPDYYSENVPLAGASTLKFGVQNSGAMAVDPSLLVGSVIAPNTDVQYSDHDKLHRPTWGAQNRPISW